MTARRSNHHRGILRALTQRPQSKMQLIKYLGAQDAWDAVDRALQRLRRAGLIVYVVATRRWMLTPKGIKAWDGTTDPLA